MGPWFPQRELLSRIVPAFRIPLPFLVIASLEKHLIHRKNLLVGSCKFFAASLYLQKCGE